MGNTKFYKAWGEKNRSTGLAKDIDTAFTSTHKMQAADWTKAQKDNEESLIPHVKKLTAAAAGANIVHYISSFFCGGDYYKKDLPKEDDKTKKDDKSKKNPKQNKDKTGDKNKKRSGDKNKDGKTGKGGDDTEGGFPVWAIILIIVAVLAIIGAVVYFMMARI